MKLNPDCIRDILLDIEDKTTPTSEWVLECFVIPPSLNNYTYDEILYHLRQCNMMKFFKSYVEDIVGDCTVSDLTPQAHEFLANIRNDSIWYKTKEKAKKIGSFSLDVLIQIASSIISDIIHNNHF